MRRGTKAYSPPQAARSLGLLDKPWRADAQTDKQTIRRGAGPLRALALLLGATICVAALLLWLRPEKTSVGGPASVWVAWDERNALTAAAAGIAVDVVSVSVKPTCVTRRSVAALNSYLGPRHIHVVTGSAPQCEIFRGHAPNVHCWLENSLLPGVDKPKIAKWIAEHAGRDGDEEFNGRHLAGWYLQQFIKIGAAGSIPGLSEYFVVWDTDMILLRPLKLFQLSRAVIDNGAMAAASSPQGSQAQDGAPQHRQDEAVPGFVVRTRVNVGGAHAPGYESAHLNLFGERLSKAPDGSSFVTHWIVARKSLMQEFVGRIQKPKSRSVVPRFSSSAAINGTDWAWAVLGAVRPEEITQGFSEYASYISWVHQHQPGTQAVARKRDWLRHPLGGRPLVQALRHLDRGGLCCPSPVHIWLTGLLGYQYTGFEIGHTDGCGYTDPRYDLQYGLSSGSSGTDVNSSLYS